ncbi:GNAT family N-acetyltransferase [Mesotoga prima]|uniref:GNAT family N-acetyltransferase n=3 Tax=Mesotoga TaxID=1184396 RepID=UPI002C28F05F|nr:GNAT family N-acetyltransferase [Mesotoga prima]HUM22667.1 GNAT family N-acetyltransferase [Mesotoga prima]
MKTVSLISPIGGIMIEDFFVDKPSSEESKGIMEKMYHSIPESSNGRYSLSELRPIEEVYFDFLKRGDKLLVLRGQGEIIGHVHFGPQRDERFSSNLSGHIYDLYVKKEYRGMGAGRTLLRSALKELKPFFQKITGNTYRFGTGWHMLKSEGFSEKRITLSTNKRLADSRTNAFEIFRGLPEDLGKVFVEISSSPSLVENQLQMTSSELFFNLNEIMDSGGRILICRQDEETVGVLIYSVFEDIMTYSLLGSIEFVFVSKRFRRMGIGRNLLSFLNEYLSISGVEESFFECAFESDYHLWSEAIGMKEFSVLLEKKL